MKLYFTPAQIPELAGLTKRQRKAVVQCALQAYYHEDVSRVWFGIPWLLGGVLGGALLGYGVVSCTSLSHPKLITGLCAVGGAVLALFLAGQVQFARLRPYFRRVLDERQSELAQLR